MTHDHDSWWRVAKQNIGQLFDGIAERARAEGYEVGLRTALDVVRKSGSLSATILALEAQLPAEPDVAAVPDAPVQVDADAKPTVPLAFITGPHVGECACGSGKPFAECHGAAQHDGAPPDGVA